MAAEFHVFLHVAVFLLLSTVVGEGDVSRKGELRIMRKERTRKPHPNPKPLEQLRIVDGGPFFPHDPKLTMQAHGIV